MIFTIILVEIHFHRIWEDTIQFLNLLGTDIVQVPRSIDLKPLKNLIKDILTHAQLEVRIHRLDFREHRLYRLRDLIIASLKNIQDGHDMVIDQVAARLIHLI